MARSILALLLPITIGGASCSPEGTVERLQPAALTSTVAGRRAEVTAWAMREHSRLQHEIARTDTLPDGTVVDWVVDRIGIRPPRLDRPHPPVHPIDQANQLHGPPGTAPHIRPAFSTYVDGTSGAKSLEEHILRTVGGNPNAPNNRLYGGVDHVATNFGLTASFNNNWGQTGSDLPSGFDFSFMEGAVFCNPPGVGMTLLGATLGYNPSVYSSGLTLGLEFWGPPYQKNWVGGGGTLAGYLPVGGATRAVGQALPGSSIPSDPNNQIERFISIEHWDNPQFGTQSWYIYFIDQYIGAVFINLAPSMSGLGSSACHAEWYGEAMDNDSLSTTWMNADLGSGLLPTGSTFLSNFTTRGYIRTPFYYTRTMTPADSNGGGVRLAAGAFNTITAPVDPKCYGSLFTDDTVNDPVRHPTLFIGGPGHTTTNGCN